MIENNKATVGVATDYGIATILGNFSDDMIGDIIKEALNYKFRPFSTREPNYPEILNNQLNIVKYHSTGYDENIEECRSQVLGTIIDTINEYYNLTINNPVPEEQLYTLSYVIYQIFVSEFTERMINFFTQFIINNINSILNTMKAEDKVVKSIYAKKIYNNTDYIVIYDNIDKVLNILAGLDIPLESLIEYLSDKNTSDLICSYIADCGDIYKDKFVPYLLNPATNADVMTEIRFKFVQATMENKNNINIENMIQ